MPLEETPYFPDDFSSSYSTGLPFSISFCSWLSFGANPLNLPKSDPKPLKIPYFKSSFFSSFFCSSFSTNCFSSSFSWLSSFLSFSSSFYSSGTSRVGFFFTNLEKNEPNLFFIVYSSIFSYFSWSFSSILSSFFSSSSFFCSSSGIYSYFLLKRPPKNDFKFAGFFSISFSFSFSWSYSFSFSFSFFVYSSGFCSGYSSTSSSFFGSSGFLLKKPPKKALKFIGFFSSGCGVSSAIGVS